MEFKLGREQSDDMRDMKDSEKWLDQWTVDQGMEVKGLSGLG